MPTFLGDYGYIGILLIIAGLLPLSMLAIPILLRRFGIVASKPSQAKNSTYECGMDTVGSAWVQFNFRYYIYALLFVIFDIETVFLYPWAVAYRQLAWFTLAEVLLFMSILVAGLVFAWKKKALEWK